MALALPRQRHVSATRAGSGPGSQVEHGDWFTVSKHGEPITVFNRNAVSGVSIEHGEPITVSRHDEGPGSSSVHEWPAWEDPSCTHREWTNRGVTTTDLLDVSRSDEEYVTETDEEDQGRIDADSSDEKASFVACSLDPDHDGGLNALACAIRDEGVEWIENSNANNEDVPDPVEFVEFEDQRQRFGPPSDEAWANRTFSDKSSLVRALDAWHIAHNMQLKVVKSNTTRYTVRCVVDSCPWRLHASQPKGICIVFLYRIL
uniref:Transposase MuDR plant domain-containing protein n=1 Tax=Ananas comosus var. bracteatus TaxID=296719 RepID=A0A6V7NT59_ANACO|nr:unnamed protein product [Ananas comosus var. bracteatus]